MEMYKYLIQEKLTLISKYDLKTQKSHNQNIIII